MKSTTGQNFEWNPVLNVPTGFFCCKHFWSIKKGFGLCFFCVLCFRIPISIKVWWIEGSFPGLRETYLDHGNKVPDQPILASGKPFELGNLTRTPNTRVQEKANWGRGIGYETCVSTPGVVGLGGNCYPSLKPILVPPYPSRLTI